MVAAALRASNRFLGFTADRMTPIPMLLTGVKWSTASIHFGIGGSTPAFGRLRHCRTAKTRRSTPSTIWNVFVPSADDPLVLAPAAFATVSPTTPTTARPTTQPATKAGPFERARGVTSMSTTPMIGIGLIPAAIAIGRICPIACLIVRGPRGSGEGGARGQRVPRTSRPGRSPVSRSRSRVWAPATTVAT